MSSEKRHRVQPVQHGRLRKLRRESTFPERLLWSRLRGSQLAGLKFKRQYAIGPYIADFYCAAASLVVELDGLSHVGRVDEDQRRSAYLDAQGLRVVRYANDQVIENVDAVAEDIARQAGVEW
ncbi:MAG: endonuclease domain-containing protein [Phycisphaeraceae bacterium]